MIRTPARALTRSRKGELFFFYHPQSRNAALQRFNHSLLKEFRLIFHKSQFIHQHQMTARCIFGQSLSHAVKHLRKTFPETRTHRSLPPRRIPKKTAVFRLCRIRRRQVEIPALPASFAVSALLRRLYRDKTADLPIGCLSVTLRIIVLFPTCTSPVSRIFNISPLFYPFFGPHVYSANDSAAGKIIRKRKMPRQIQSLFSFSASAYSYAAASPGKLWPPSQWPSVRNALSRRRPPVPASRQR